MTPKLAQLAAIASRLGAPGDDELVREGVVGAASVLQLLRAYVQRGLCSRGWVPVDRELVWHECQGLPLEKARRIPALRAAAADCLDLMPVEETGGLVEVRVVLLRAVDRHFGRLVADLGEIHALDLGVYQLSESP